ncbi:MAG: response regulator [Spirochaetota bacterium]
MGIGYLPAQESAGTNSSTNPSAKRILVVDDDPKTVELVKLYLSRDGHTVETAFDGPTALRRAREHTPDLLVLDIMLPGLDGIELCKRLRNESDVLILMLTARADGEDIVRGLEAGADDYMVKPFSPRELAARSRAVLRRLPQDYHLRGAARVTCEALTVDFERHEVTVAGKPCRLTPVEFRLLGILLREPGRVFSREQLVERLFGYDYDGLERSIDVHILRLRAKVEPDRAKPRFIRTVYGAGYTFGPAPRDRLETGGSSGASA